MAMFGGSLPLKADVWGMCDGSHVKLNRLRMVFWILASSDFEHRKDTKKTKQQE